jgi:hypothetical protein
MWMAMMPIKGGLPPLDSIIPGNWSAKFQSGYYFGTSFAQESLEDYADEIVKSDNLAWESLMAVAGTAAGAWQENTWQTTATVLTTAYLSAGSAAKTGPRIEMKIAWHGGGPHTYPHLEIRAFSGSGKYLGRWQGPNSMSKGLRDFFRTHKPGWWRWG